MNYFGEMLAVDHETALKFFYQHLSDEVGARSEATERELKYVASILANYCSTSIGGGSVEGGSPFHGDLTDIFDNYIFSNEGGNDSELMEFAGAQTLLYAGFFQTQHKDRHKISWFIQMGCTFYGRAGDLSNNEKRKIFLRNFSTRFMYWSEICHKLSLTFRNFANESLVIKLSPEK